MTTRIDKYNEGKYSQKVFLLYDGIHYDPLYWDTGIEGVGSQVAFQASEKVVDEEAIKFAAVLQAARQYTDTGKFKLRCGNCQKRFAGEKELLEHANKTGHFNFQEI